MSEDTGSTLGKSYFGRIVRGILKLLFAPVIFAFLANINIPDLDIGGNIVSGSMLKALFQFIIPIYLVISALHDFGVEL